MTNYTIIFQMMFIVGLTSGYIYMLNNGPISWSSTSLSQEKREALKARLMEMRHQNEYAKDFDNDDSNSKSKLDHIAIADELKI